jgi:uncharacterized membrane protein YedE/YeeE
VGLILGAPLWWLFFAHGVAQSTQVPASQLGVGGFMVGYGARLGNGCSSGHGTCGLESLQLLSLLAALTFMATLVGRCLFGFGLALSTMIEPEVVLSFFALSRGTRWYHVGSFGAGLARQGLISSQ